MAEDRGVTGTSALIDHNVGRDRIVVGTDGTIGDSQTVAFSGSALDQIVEFRVQINA